MAKAPTLSPDAARVNKPVPSVPDAPAINAAAPATPGSTPIPGGGCWRWDYDHACWVDTLAAAAALPAPISTSFPVLE